MDVLSSRVLLQPADFDASLRFYEGTLGLTRYREWGSPPGRGVVFFLGGGMLELTETAPGGDAGPRPAGVRLWLQVPDAEAFWQAIPEQEATKLDPPQRKPWGLIESHLTDPDGLELVVVETPSDHPIRRRAEDE